MTDIGMSHSQCLTGQCEIWDREECCTPRAWISKLTEVLVHGKDMKLVMVERSLSPQR